MEFKIITHAPELAEPIPSKATAKPNVRPERPSSANGRPAEPTTMELAANFTAAVGRWASAGFRTITAETYAARAGACDSCEFWDGKARLGLGKCGAPGCGCTSLKRWLATEKCPHPKGSRWPVDKAS